MNEILQKRIEEKSKELGQMFFPDNMNVFARPNWEAGYIETACKEIANFALQNQWIPVSEALPKCDRCHLAMYEDGGIIVAKYENETWWWQDGFVVGRNTDGDLMYSSSCKVPSGLITHWMMIPTINKEEK